MGTSNSTSGKLGKTSELNLFSYYQLISPTEKQLIKNLTETMIETLCENFRSLVLIFSYLANSNDPELQKFREEQSGSEYIIWLSQLNQTTSEQQNSLEKIRFDFVKKLWPDFGKYETNFSRDIKLLLKADPRSLEIFFKNLDKDWNLKSQLEELDQCLELHKSNNYTEKIDSELIHKKRIFTEVKGNSSLTAARNMECRASPQSINLDTGGEKSYLDTETNSLINKLALGTAKLPKIQNQSFDENSGRKENEQGLSLFSLSPSGRRGSKFENVIFDSMAAKKLIKNSIGNKHGLLNSPNRNNFKSKPSLLQLKSISPRKEPKSRFGVIFY